MLHLPAWDVASLSVACPKVWRTLRSPNKSPEHQPAAKAGRQSLEDTDNGKGQETDIGIPLGSENGLGTKLGIFGFRGLMPVLCPVTIGPKGKKYVNPPYLKTRQGLDINTIINKSGTHVTRIMQMLFSDLHDSRHHVFRGKGSSSQKSFSGVSALPPLIPNEMITPMNLLKLVRI